MRWVRWTSGSNSQSMARGARFVVSAPALTSDLCGHVGSLADCLESCRGRRFGLRFSHMLFASHFLLRFSFYTFLLIASWCRCTNLHRKGAPGHRYSTKKQLDLSAQTTATEPRYSGALSRRSTCTITGYCCRRWYCSISRR